MPEPGATILLVDDSRTMRAILRRTLLAAGYQVIEAEDGAEGVTRCRNDHPDLVLLGSEPFPFEERHKDELAAVTGLARERFLLADGEYLSWHGSRTRDGIDYAESLIQKARRVL